ncbi:MULTISPECIES: bifunctional DNA primase/polymerase [unclassified Beijerinckia]|uniref:bifunctional DNA primase/polymerase n=1 Tax=unclassified Beijerinckia TaxID=2638183 RepID=UPI00089BFF8A|nr:MULTISPECIES: bifunctional DNA primase/polymerase [unclassified Beijerinckia]MDH7796416.1 putative DNA primase/helicase [Beijerinckia sp. GAS462]SEC44155.1 Phage-or plasmid-associated DNA primase [Beijerinckia sp. 28-YEA-48]
MGIFSENAPGYWAAGLSVIPITRPDPSGADKAAGKRPAISTWQRYSAVPVGDAEQAGWLQMFPDHNMGLVLGQASGLVALDVDSDEPGILNAIDSITPKSPWLRRGRKGYVKLFKYQGQNTFHVKLADGTNVLDFLSTGAQVLLPPSIHPGLMAPYTANCDLLDVLGQIGTLPTSFGELARDALRQNGYEVASGAARVGFVNWVPAGGRDNALVRFAGGIVSDIIKGNITLKEGLDVGFQWVQDRVEKVPGDELPPAKMTEKIVEWLRKDLFGPKKLTLPAGWDEGMTVDQLKELGLDDITSENRRFSYQEIIDDFHAKIQSDGLDHTNPKMTELVGIMCARVAGNPGITPLEQQHIVKVLQGATANNLTAASILRQIREFQKGDIAGNDQTEIARAVIDNVERTGELRFSNEMFYQWQGAHWVPMEAADLQKIVATEYGNFPACKKDNDYRAVVKVMATLTRADLKQRDIRGINFVNGYLTEDLTLQPHNKDFGCTYVLPYPYQPELAGKATMFSELLVRYWGTDPDFADKVEALQEAFAATLFGVAPQYFRVFCLYGPADTGKSRILRIMQGLMPDGCAAAVAPKFWNNQFSVAELTDKVLNVAGELSERDLISGDIFKLVVEGSTIQAQRKYQPLYKFNPIAAHWFASNVLPRTDDSSAGFTRRWLFLEFSNSIETKDRIVNIDQLILEQEREAIAAWAVQGLITLKDRAEYCVPASSLELCKRVENRTNPVRFFLANSHHRGHLKLGVGENGASSEATTPARQVYLAYRLFCVSEANVQPAAYETFIDRMRQLQKEFGFKEVLDGLGKTSRAGSGDSAYRFLTIVDPTKPTKPSK